MKKHLGRRRVLRVLAAGALTATGGAAAAACGESRAAGRSPTAVKTVTTDVPRAPESKPTGTAQAATKRADSAALPTRTLGRTGHASTLVTFGAVAVGSESQTVADEAIELMLRYGVNHIDVAPSYGSAMERLAPWMPKIRDKVFLGAKTQSRTKEAAWEGIRSCQNRLGVEKFDLFQLHAVTSMEALDMVTGPGGALEALVEMRDRGLTKWIGITGHGPAAPKVQLEALKRFDFDTIMFPVAAALYRNSEYRRDAEALLAEANGRNVGVQTIKMLARGGWASRPRDLVTWYDAHREQADIDQALWFVLSQPMHTAPSAGDTSLLPKVLDAAARFRALNPQEQERVIAAQRPEIPSHSLVFRRGEAPTPGPLLLLRSGGGQGRD